MKPAAFRYLAPIHIDEALESLARSEEDARVLAGGQSLVPAMNFRLATPQILIDINGIGGFGDVRETNGELVIGMLVRHKSFEVAVTDDPLGRLLARTARLVGHVPIRVRGTFAGSVAHADPAAEWCMLAQALDATIVARSVLGERRIRALDFFEGPFTTSLTSDEIITEVHLPLLGSAGWAVHEKSHTAGDFATVAVVTVVELNAGFIARARIAVAGVEGRPIRATEAEAVLTGASPDPDTFKAAASTAAENTSPIPNTLASTDYKRHLVEVLVARALEEAAKKAE
jgi:aerobic carbon-monoxide dehydrogenase medium subunit